MGVTMIVMTDGRRDCIAQAAATWHLIDGVTDRIIHDDSGDPAYTDWLRETFPTFTVYATPGRSGFAGAYRSAWELLRRTTNPWIFSTEDDFCFARPVDLAAIIDVMNRRPLAQVALLRQPWNAAEQAAGGIIDQHPHDYTDWTFNGLQWLEHRRFWTTNPHLTRRDFIATHDWPEGEQSEGRFGVDLFAAEPQTRVAFWGARTDGPWVQHVGTQRVGTGY